MTAITLGGCRPIRFGPAARRVLAAKSWASVAEAEVTGSPDVTRPSLVTYSTAKMS